MISVTYDAAGAGVWNTTQRGSASPDRKVFGGSTPIGGLGSWIEGVYASLAGDRGTRVSLGGWTSQPPLSKRRFPA